MKRADGFYYNMQLRNPNNLYWDSSNCNIPAIYHTKTHSFSVIRFIKSLFGF